MIIFMFYRMTPAIAFNAGFLPSGQSKAEVQKCTMIPVCTLMGISVVELHNICLCNHIRTLYYIHDPYSYNTPNWLLIVEVYLHSFVT